MLQKVNMCTQMNILCPQHKVNKNVLMQFTFVYQWIRRSWAIKMHRTGVSLATYMLGMCQQITFWTVCTLWVYLVKSASVSLDTDDPY